MRMKHLITGGAGFIGSHLADALIARGDNVVILDDFSTGNRKNIESLLDGDGAELVEGSVLDEDLVDALLEGSDSCFHLAAAVGVQLVVAKPLEALRSNVRGADVVISAATRRQTPLMFVSTSEIYGKLSADSLHEDSDRILGATSKSRWGYSMAKAIGEMLAYECYREHGLPATVVRLFNTVGPRQTGTYGMVLPRFVGRALAGEDLLVYGDGTQTRCFTHVDDTVDAILRLSGSSEAAGRAFNVGSPHEIGIEDLARRVIERSASASPIRHVPYDEAYPKGFEELGRRRPDTAALRELTGWTTRRTIDDAIDDVIAEQASERTAVTASPDAIPMEQVPLAG
jgi:UDP-glucose 4-epimerase